MNATLDRCCFENLFALFLGVKVYKGPLTSGVSLRINCIVSIDCEAHLGRKIFSGHTLLDSTNSDISVSVEWCLPLPEFLQCTWILIVPNDDVFCLPLSKGRALPVEPWQTESTRFYIVTLPGVVYFVIFLFQ